MARGPVRGVGTVEVVGVRKLMRTIDESEADVDVWLKEGLLAIGERVAVDVRSAYSEYSVPGAEGVKSKVWRSGTVLVAQTLRKSRNPLRSRPNFGGLMMRKAFLPALDKNKEAAAASAEALLHGLEEKWTA